LLGSVHGVAVDGVGFEIAVLTIAAVLLRRTIVGHAG
jgi:hypothetical protein